MNQKPTKPIGWKKALVIVAILGIAGYQWYAENQAAPPMDQAVAAQNGDDPNVEGQANPGGLGGKPDATGTPRRDSDRDQNGSPALVAGDKTAAASSGTADRSANRQPSTRNSNAPAQPKFLVAIGKNQFQSPAGLIYGMGGGGEHRIDHVMRHARDDPSRPAHGVFEGTKNEILELLDDVYGMIKQKSKYVKSEKSRGNTAYTVSLGRKVGYEGGQKGKRSGNRSLTSVRLVLDGNRVITAYPYR